MLATSKKKMTENKVKNFITIIMMILLSSTISLSQEVKSKKTLNEYPERNSKLSRLEIEIDKNIPHSKIHLNLVKSKSDTIIKFRDSLGGYYLSSGLYEFSVLLDSQICIYYSDTINIETSNTRIINLKMSDILDNSTIESLLIDEVIKEDTLEWIQISNNSWVVTYDTLKIFQKNDKLKILWKEKNNEYSNYLNNGNPILVTEEIKAQLRNIESKFKYLKGFNKTEFSYCLDCNGTQSYHIIKFRNLTKFYTEPSCNNQYWSNFKSLILKEVSR
jgi:hypothetical protein